VNALHKESPTYFFYMFGCARLVVGEFLFFYTNVFNPYSNGKYNFASGMNTIFSFHSSRCPYRLAVLLYVHYSNQSLTEKEGNRTCQTTILTVEKRSKRPCQISRIYSYYRRVFITTTCRDSTITLRSIQIYVQRIWERIFSDIFNSI
jgi:hypothetical protein